MHRVWEWESWKGSRKGFYQRIKRGEWAAKVGLGSTSILGPAPGGTVTLTLGFWCLY